MAQVINLIFFYYNLTSCCSKLFACLFVSQSVITGKSINIAFLLTAHLERSLKIAKDEIETYTESTISKQKDIANEVLLFITYNIFFVIDK